MLTRIASLIVTCLLLAFGRGVANARVLYDYILSGSCDGAGWNGSFIGTLNFDVTTIQFTDALIRFTNSDGSIAGFTNIVGNYTLGPSIQCDVGCGSPFHLKLTESDRSGDYVDWRPVRSGTCTAFSSRPSPRP
jgi:hypothetical protein